MVKVKEDMTGWNMWEHGIPDSKLTVIKQVDDYVSPSGHHQAQYLCRCNCDKGKTIITRALWVKNGHTKSCGCMTGKNFKHNLSNTRLYSVWNEIKQRCLNPKSPAYHDYGGRGISVCDEWKNDFMSFRTWALSLGYKDNANRGEYTIDRINNNGDYCPENCRLTTMKEQGNNKRNNLVITIDGTTLTLSQWAEKMNISNKLIRNRLYSGWSEYDAIMTQKNKGRRSDGIM